jgi:hypothetical protein
MTLVTRIFQGQTPSQDLSKYVNDNGITSANIQHIDVFDGIWFLFYWE